MYDFHIDSVLDFVRSKNARTVAIQMPEGLKTHALEVSDMISGATGARCIVLGDPCYGACDVKVDFPRYADVLIHFGHAEIPSLGTSGRTLYIEVGLPFPVEPLLQKALPLLGPRVGLITTIQHVGALGHVKEVLDGWGKQCLIGHGDGRVKYPGQVLGCNISAALAICREVDCYLYIGSGNFHPISVAVETSKPVIVLDPVMNDVRELTDMRDRVLRQRHAAIVRSKDAKRFGILVSPKVGQDRFALAMDISDQLKGKGLKGDIIIIEEITPDSLLPYPEDAFVSTACPRLAIDDQVRYKKPMLTPIDLEVVLGLRRWDDYRLDMIDG
ncbi:MAG TPA: diphthamide biosynthesis enzyme Dph2 [Methanomassiliicoccales archaeon]|nr:diphthamide biosynthesis enzyme Dph2 [Methanomassiliicoccales archaeon]